MTESAFTAKLLRALRAHPALKDAVIWKHADRLTRGIPDFSVTRGSQTLWCEIKMDLEMPTKIQEYWLRRLRFGGALICASKDGRSAAFTSPFAGKSSFVAFERLAPLIAEQF